MPSRTSDVCLVTVATESFVPGTCVLLGSFLKQHPRFAGDVVIVHDTLVVFLIRGYRKLLRTDTIPSLLWNLHIEMRIA